MYYSSYGIPGIWYLRVGKPYGLGWKSLNQHYAGDVTQRFWSDCACSCIFVAARIQLYAKAVVVVVRCLGVCVAVCNSPRSSRGRINTSTSKYNNIGHIT